MAGDISIDVVYFAILREQSGMARERVAVVAGTTCAMLYDRLGALHAFTLPASLVRAAVNDAFAPMDEALRDGDVVTFIPPVAGG